ncbi:substrate-binding domain-containing protein [Oxalobacter aliiformigenes]|nr:LysR substrate-binding domain-containing protein [Oxalobacter aliiformigenes]WAV98273.1 substrate-binding domain-containing protein [Oxalobacter aliiformigenes]
MHARTPYRNIGEAHRNQQHEVDAINGLPSGLIRIGTFSSVATHWLPPVIRAFGKDYPKIAFELLLGDYATMPKSGNGSCRAG